MTESVAVKKAPKKKAPAAPKAASKQPPKAPKSLYAVFATGGKQYRVSVGGKVKIEKLGSDHKEGDKLTFDQVLLIEDGAEVKIGKPFVTGSEVKATLTKIARYKTIDVIKYKQKSRYFKKYGHRQPYFEIQIDSIK